MSLSVSVTLLPYIKLADILVGPVIYEGAGCEHVCTATLKQKREKLKLVPQTMKKVKRLP